MPTINPNPGQVHHDDVSPFFANPTGASSPITKPGGGGFEAGDALLLEGGDFILLESGDKVLVEA